MPEARLLLHTALGKGVLPPGAVNSSWMVPHALRSRMMFHMLIERQDWGSVS